MAVSKMKAAAAAPVSQSVAASARAGRLEALTALRDKIAAMIDEGVPPRDMASLSKRLIEVMDDINSLETSEEGKAVSVDDERWTPEAV